MVSRTRPSIFVRLLQVVWSLGPLALGWLVFDTSESAPGGSSGIASIAAEMLIFTAWSGGIVAVVRLRPTNLVYLRAAGGSGIVWGGVAIASGFEAGAIALGWGLTVLILSFSPQVTIEAASRDSAPRERRFPLALPAGLLAFMVVPSTLVAGAGLGFIPAWLLGARPTGTRLLFVLIALVASPVILVSLNRLSRRWLVVVPSGVVLHDPMLLAETYRLTPEEIAWVEFAPPKWRRIAAEEKVADATAGCATRPLIIVLGKPMPGPMLRPSRINGSRLIDMIACRPVDRAHALTTLRSAGYERPLIEEGAGSG